MKNWTDTDATKRPLTGDLLVLALAGELPPMLTPDELLRLWLPLCRDEEPTTKAKRVAVAKMIRKAIEKKTLPSIKSPDTTKIVKAPLGGHHAGWRSRIKSPDYDESDELWAKTSDWPQLVPGLVFVRDSDVRQLVAVARAHLKPSSDAPLWLWIETGEPDCASVNGRKGRGERGHSAKFLACAALASRSPLAANGNASRSAAELLAGDGGKSAKIAGASVAYLAKHLRGEFAATSESKTTQKKKRS
ncbi:MAG: hypothetical protein V4650_11410 [Pseudomonadota bacterium]